MVGVTGFEPATYTSRTYFVLSPSVVSFGKVWWVKAVKALQQRCLRQLSLIGIGCHPLTLLPHLWRT
jgi:hypothetical protein